MTDADDAVEAHLAAKARMLDQVTHSVVHATFNLERSYDASPARVWKALTRSTRWRKPNGLRRPNKLEILERVMDVRPGGARASPARAVGAEARRLDL